jgi:hypothetical protein
MSYFINSLGGKKIKCPSCAKEQNLAGLSPWFSPEGKPVCLNQMTATPRALQPFIADRVERNLLIWYPELRHNLPEKYQPRSEGAGPS